MPADRDHPAEIDELRSKFIRGLVLAPTDECHTVPTCEIPQVLVQYWDNLTTLPPDVRECIDSWATLELIGFSRRLFDDVSARAFIAENFDERYLYAFNRCHHPAMRCDYFRLCYILFHGGFYVDADDVLQNPDCTYLFRDSRLKLQPLCYDISTDTMVRPEVFRIPSETKDCWIFYVNNNPIAAPPNHHVIRLALERATSTLLASTSPLPIQSTTGPGNLSASLVRHAMTLATRGIKADFSLVSAWDGTAVSKWPLSYRSDVRNWRRWTPPRDYT